MRWGRVMPRKHVMEALMLAIEEAEIRAEDIRLHTKKGKNAAMHLEDKSETTTVMVHAGKINETTALCLTTAEEWRHAISEYHYIIYIKRILSGP